MIRVLVAEDEPPIMRANVALIEGANLGFHVVATAINGKKAIEELEKQKIDVIFTDIKMPIIDGLELAKYIRDNYPNIITVITSGYSDFEYARRGIEFKVMDYLLKPISKANILKVLNNIKNEISRKIILTKSQILCDNNYIENHTEPKYLKNQVESIGRYLKRGEKEKVRECILEVFKAMEKTNSTQDEVINFFDMIINYCYFNVGFVKNNISIIKKELYETLNNFIDYIGVAEDVVSVLFNIAEINQEEVVKSPKVIKDIKEYLKSNYQKSITNTVLSREFGFVPSYISRLFKQYNNGISPGEYLSNYRIEKAKEIMREQPELLVKEIADMVGFNDAYYFSKIFKKRTGMWPTKYVRDK